MLEFTSEDELYDIEHQAMPVPCMVKLVQEIRQLQAKLQAKQDGSQSLMELCKTTNENVQHLIDHFSAITEWHDNKEAAEMDGYGFNSPYPRFRKPFSL